MAGRRLMVPLRVTEDGYSPVDEAGRKQHAKLKPGTIVGGEIARSRSVVQNSLYWTVLTAVVNHAPGQWRTPEALHEALKVATGHIQTVRLINGRLVLLPESTAFDAMTQDQFNAYTTAAFRLIEDEILGGEMSIDEMLANVDRAEGRRHAHHWEGADASVVGHALQGNFG